MCLKASPSLSSPKYWVLPPKILETSECLLHVTKLLFPGMISRASSSASQKPSQLKLWRTSGSGIITSTSNTWEYCLGFGAHGDPEASHFVFEAPSYLWEIWSKHSCGTLQGGHFPSIHKTDCSKDKKTPFYVFIFVNILLPSPSLPLRFACNTGRGSCHTFLLLLLLRTDLFLRLNSRNTFTNTEWSILRKYLAFCNSSCSCWDPGDRSVSLGRQADTMRRDWWKAESRWKFPDLPGL